MRLLLLLTAVLFTVRAWAAQRVGFGDSEALYASWALHPQPAYLDHPGLVGTFARLVGGGTAPAPAAAHLATAGLAALVPLLVAAAARQAGASRERAAAAGVVVLLVPEIAVGLFAMTPDLLLAPLWVGAIGLALLGTDAKRETALLGAGLLAGIAACAKISGLLLVVALAVFYVQHARLRRSFWAWAGLAAGLLAFSPVVRWEAAEGFPMLRHRFVETQPGAGVALRNLGALVGGQLLYLSPVVAVLAVLLARDLVRRRREDDASRLLFLAFAVPVVPLVALSLWSRVAEPHWVAPALLVLPVHAARRGLARVRLAAGVAAAVSAAAYAWVLVPEATRLFPDGSTADLATELYGWPRAIQAVKEQLAQTATPLDPQGRDVVVVGPHWTICAQLQAALPEQRVGCATPIPDDFDRWLPRSTWRGADVVLWVTDARYPGEPPLPEHVKVSQSRVRVLRGGRTARIFELGMFTRRSAASL